MDRALSYMFWDPVFLLQNEKNETFYIKKSGLRGKNFTFTKLRWTSYLEGRYPSLLSVKLYSYIYVYFA